MPDPTAETVETAETCCHGRPLLDCHGCLTIAALMAETEAEQKLETHKAHGRMRKGRPAANRRFECKHKLAAARCIEPECHEIWLTHLREWSKVNYVKRRKVAQDLGVIGATPDNTREITDFRPPTAARSLDRRRRNASTEAKIAKRNARAQERGDTSMPGLTAAEIASLCDTVDVVHHGHWEVEEDVPLNDIRAAIAERFGCGRAELSNFKSSVSPFRVRLDAWSTADEQPYYQELDLASVEHIEGGPYIDATYSRIRLAERREDDWKDRLRRLRSTQDDESRPLFWYPELE